MGFVDGKLRVAGLNEAVGVEMRCGPEMSETALRQSYLRTAESSMFVRTP